MNFFSFVLCNFNFFFNIKTIYIFKQQLHYFKFLATNTTARSVDFTLLPQIALQKSNKTYKKSTSVARKRHTLFYFTNAVLREHCLERAFWERVIFCDVLVDEHIQMLRYATARRPYFLAIIRRGASLLSEQVG